MTVSSRGLIAYRDTIQTRSLPRGNLPPDDACVRSGLEPVLASIQATARHALPSSAHCQLMSAVAVARHTQGVAVCVRHSFLAHSSNPELFVAESLNFDLCTFLTICQVMGQLSKT